MTPKQVKDAIEDALAYAGQTGRTPVVRIVMTWGTVIDTKAVRVEDGMVILQDMNDALVVIDPHCIGIIAGGLRPLPDSAEIDIQEGELTPKVTQ